MLALDHDENLRKHPAELDDLYLLGLNLEVRARQAAGEELLDIADDLGMSRTTLFRRLREAKDRGERA